MNRYHLYAQGCADYPKIVGFQVRHRKTDDCWEGRDGNEVLSYNTALDHFRAASQGSEVYRLCAVQEGDLDEPTFETPVEEAQRIVGFQVSCKSGHCWRHSGIEVLAFKVAMEYWQEALADDAQSEWELVIVHDGDIEYAQFLTSVLDPRE